MKTREKQASSESWSLRRNVAKCLHDELGQHLAGSLLAARVLVNGLARRKAPEAKSAEKLFELLNIANEDINKLIAKLDRGRLR